MRQTHTRRKRSYSQKLPKTSFLDINEFKDKRNLLKNCDENGFHERFKYFKNTDDFKNQKKQKRS